MLRSTPRERIALNLLPRRFGEASITRWRTMFRRTVRAIGTTIPGNHREKTPPRWMSPRRGAGRNDGVKRVMDRRFRAATRNDSGRTTPSTKPTANASPFGSRSKPASLSEATEGGIVAEVRIHSFTCSIDSRMSSSVLSIVGIEANSVGTD